MLRNLQHLAASRTEMGTDGALVTIPAHQRGIRDGKWRGHKLSSNSVGLKDKKKWLAIAVANHLSDRAEMHSRHRRKAVQPLRRKAAPAAATSRSIGVLKHKALAHERFFVLKRRAVQIEQAFRVNEDARPEFLKDLVAIARLGIQPHGIRQAGTAAALHTHAQPAGFRRHTFLSEQRNDLLRRMLGEVNRRAHFASGWSCNFRRHNALPDTLLERITRQHPPTVNLLPPEGRHY